MFDKKKWLIEYRFLYTIDDSVLFVAEQQSKC